VDCKWVLQEQQRKLLVGCQDIGKENDLELQNRLHLVSTVIVDSPLFNLCYGGSPFGQYFACTVDMMHAYEHGVIVYVLKEPISGPKKKQIDILSRLMFANHRSAERDTYPRTNFTKGVTHLKLMRCYKWPGFLLVHLVLAQSYKGAALLKGRMDDNAKDFGKKVICQTKKLLVKKKHRKQLRNMGHKTGFASLSDDSDENKSDSNSCVTEEQSINAGETNDDIEEDLLDAPPRCTTDDFVTLMSTDVNLPRIL
jgi:hypothetical protein